MKKTGQHLTEAERQAIVALYRRLKHTTLVAEASGYSKASIRRALHKAGIRPTKGRVGACHRRHDSVKAWYEEGRTLKAIATALGTNTTTVSNYAQLHGFERPEWMRLKPGEWRWNTRGGERHPRWQGGRTQDKDGYWLVKRPDHPLATALGYVREHRLVMEQRLGRYLTRNEVVHHKNGVTSDNRPENLELFESNGEHLRETLTGVPCPQRGRKRTPNPEGSGSDAGQPRPLSGPSAS